MFLLLKNLQNLQFFFMSRLRLSINFNQYPELTSSEQLAQMKKKADNLPMASSFLISKLKRIQKTENLNCKSWQTCQGKQISKAICTCNKLKVTQSETFSPSEYLQKCPPRNKLHAACPIHYQAK